MILSKKVLIVSGASQNHCKSLKQFLSTVAFDMFDCIVYDLGLEIESCDELIRLYPTINLVKFDYSKYPSYYNIHINAGEYAWKPAILNEVLKTVKETKAPTEILIWCDSGNKIVNPHLTQLIPFTYANKIYSPSSSGDILRWTHPLTLSWFKIPTTSTFLKHCNRNGAILCFNITNDTVCNFITDFSRCASIKECIAPEGSSRANHRQDQAVFTVLYYMFINLNKGINICDRYLDITIHNDCD